MSGTSDKARFYMEQAVPQLQEFEQKKIFTKEEIRTLVKKRSDFEHKVLARGSTPVDFARYAAWEISLERLRQKRCKRLRIKSTSHAGQGRILSIFDRGTRKHPGDVALWMSYLEFAREAKATKKFKTVLTSAIRLHPAKPALWLYAAKWTLELEADMNGARSYMQRGTRFCNRNRELWIEYAKLEMIYLAKISMRRRILGLDGESAAQSAKAIEESPEDPGFATSEDMILLPDYKVPTIQQDTIQRVEVDGDAVKDPMTTPALNGAIPLAIFDDAKRQPFWSAEAAEDFFNMFAVFSQVSCSPRIMQHVLDTMLENFPEDASTCSCYIRQPILSINPLTSQFPAALSESLERLEISFENAKDKDELRKKTAAWITPIVAVEGLDADIQTVLQFSLRKLET